MPKYVTTVNVVIQKTITVEAGNRHTAALEAESQAMRDCIVAGLNVFSADMIEYNEIFPENKD